MKPNKEFTYIYGLIDPRTNELRYVGKTIRLNSRIVEHISKCHLTNTHKDNWISELIRENLKPIMFVIDVVLTSEWEFWEVHYIEYFKSIGCRLTNIKKGGQSPTFIKSKPSSRKGKTFDDIYGPEKGRQIKEKLLKTIKEQKRQYPRGEKHWQYGKHHSDETKQKMSINKKTTQFGVNNPMYGKHHSDETKKKLSISSKLNTKPRSGCDHPMYGKRHTVESKQKMSDSTKKVVVLQFDLNMNFIKEWDSIRSAADQLHHSPSHIGNCCRGRKPYKTAGGFIWKYKDELNK